METGIKVCDAMTKQPLCIGPDTTLAECANIMRDKRIGSLLVKEEEELVGLITEEDIVRKGLAETSNPGSIVAKEIMTKSLVTISAEKDIVHAVSLMREFNIRHLPVASDKKLMGFLTMNDIMKLEPQIFEILLEKLSMREAHNEPANKQPTSDEGICQECGEYADQLKSKAGQLICITCLNV